MPTLPKGSSVVDSTELVTHDPVFQSTLFLPRLRGTWPSRPCDRRRSEHHAHTAPRERALCAGRAQRIPSTDLHTGTGSQDLLEGPFHASLVIILKLVLIADQCKGVRDSQLQRPEANRCTASPCDPGRWPRPPLAAGHFCALASTAGTTRWQLQCGHGPNPSLTKRGLSPTETLLCSTWQHLKLGEFT